MCVIQGKNEPLQAYLHRFNTERLKVEDDSPNIITATPHWRPSSPLFLNSLFTNPPADFDAPMTRADKYMNAKEAQALTEESLSSEETRKKGLETTGSRSKGEG